ncbi:cilia- and flagella-associated protein 157-like [Dysidea avara]|uniref:cilia- and flagella-associated protein 157-like n=1 Tax=Dysidea avara TaxID=196820 RepID=UPI00331FD13B
MPGKSAKKKGDKKGGKKADESKGPPPPEKPLSDYEKPISELSKQFYVIQIKDLEERLERYQKLNDKIKLQNEDLQRTLQQQVEIQKDIVSGLRRDLLGQTDKYADLEEKMIALTQAKNQERDQFEIQLANARSEFSEIEDRLKADNIALKGKMETLEDYRLHKDDMERKLASLEKQIEAQKKHHEETIYSLEKKAVLDKDRLKKEMVSKVNLVSAEFRKVSDKQMAETTKRTIRENVAINQQLQKMSEDTTVLLQENNALKKKEKDLKREIEILQATEKELAVKNASSQKVTKMLVDKANDQDGQIATLQRKMRQFTKVETDMHDARMTSEQFSKEVKSSQSAMGMLKEELSVSEKRCAYYKQLSEGYKDILNRAAQAIHTAVQPSGSEAELLAKRDSLIFTLLEMLKSVEVTSPLHQPMTSSSTSTSKKKMMEKREVGKSSPAVMTTVPLIQYKPGDLGLVPTPRASGTPVFQRLSQASTKLPTELPPIAVNSSTYMKAKVT